MKTQRFVAVPFGVFGPPRVGVQVIDHAAATAIFAATGAIVQSPDQPITLATVHHAGSVQPTQVVRRSTIASPAKPTSLAMWLTTW